MDNVTAANKLCLGRSERLILGGLKDPEVL